MSDTGPWRDLKTNYEFQTLEKIILTDQRRVQSWSSIIRSELISSLLVPDCDLCHPHSLGLHIAGEPQVKMKPNTTTDF